MRRHSVKKEITHSSVRSSLEVDATCFVLEGQCRLRSENSSSIKTSINHKSAGFPPNHRLRKEASASRES